MRRLANRGDTIVEVLIAIAIVSLVLVIAYATAEHNVRATEDTQEHAEALQLAQRQVEFLRADNTASYTSNPGVNSCYDSSGSFAQSSVLTPFACTVHSDGTDVASSSDEPAFVENITKNSNGAYQINITWDSLLGNKDNVELFYRPQ